MRLTLRTLLAYLDDTLDPIQARQIGEKVAESGVAQELVEKIRKVARKRSITSPLSEGPESADPNLVAEYLDNDLPPEKVSEVEDQALHSDLHLAEIAACHQLLTLIMTEPAKVPPTARQRMYQLVKGPETDLNRAAPRVVPATLADIDMDDDHEESVIVSRRGGRTRLWVAGVLAIALVFVVFQATRVPDPVVTPVTPPVTVAKNEPVKAPEQEPVKAPEKVPPLNQPKEQPKTEEKKAPVEEKKADTPPQPVAPPAEPAFDRRPSDDIREIGKVSNSSVLLTAIGEGVWKRAMPLAPIVGTSRLLSLPGISNEVRLGDAAIELFGTTTEVHQDPIFESGVTLFVPANGIAADVRLDRGRIYLRSSNASQITIRVRMENDIFDVTLPDDKTEVMVERIFNADEFAKARDAGATLSAMSAGHIAPTAGQATLRLNGKDAVTLALAPKTTFWRWSSSGSVNKLEETAQPNPLWSKMPNISGSDRPIAIEMDQAEKKLPRQLGDAGKPINVALDELMIDKSRMTKRLGVYCRAALDDFVFLDVMDEATTPELRQTAVAALQNWLTRAPDRTALLTEHLVKQRRFTESEAELALRLWQGISEAARNDPKTYSTAIDALAADKICIRELGLARLSHLDPDGIRNIKYGTGDSPEMRQRGVQEWRRRIPEGQLPASRNKGA